MSGKRREGVVAAPGDRLSRLSVVGYGMGDVGNSLVFSTGMLFLLPYYTDVAGLGAAAAGMLIVVVRLYDAVVELAVGHLVDCQRGPQPQGRFRPWLRWGVLPLVLNVAVFSVPGNWPADARLAFAAITYALLGTAYALVNIPYGSLASVMTQNPSERARLGAARSLGSTLTLIFVAATVGPLLQGDHGVDSQTRLTLWLTALAVVGILFYAACHAWTGELSLARKPAPTWRDTLATLRANRPLQMLLLASVFALAGSSAAGTAALYYARNVLGDAGYFLPMILATTFAGLLVAVPLTPWLTGIFGKRFSFQLGMAMALLAHGGLYLASPISPWGAIATQAVGAIGTMIGMVSLWALEADTVEHGEQRTGLRLEGLNYALFSLVRKVGFALGGAVPAFLLAGSYSPGFAIQSPLALQQILVSITLAPALAYAVALVVMAGYSKVEPTVLRDPARLP